MHKQLIVAFVFAVGLSPLLVIGVRNGVIGRNIRIAGRLQPVTGKQAVGVGVFFILAWCVLVSVPLSHLTQGAPSAPSRAVQRRILLWKLGNIRTIFRPGSSITTIPMATVLVTSSGLSH